MPITSRQIHIISQLIVDKDKNLRGIFRKLPSADDLGMGFVHVYRKSELSSIPADGKIPDVAASTEIQRISMAVTLQDFFMRRSYDHTPRYEGSIAWYTCNQPDDHWIWKHEHVLPARLLDQYLKLDAG